MRVIGLTGGIASGKSTVSEFMANQGCPVIDADLLGHRAYEPDSAPYNALIATFGDELVSEDRSINRQVLGGKVFGNPDEMKKLTDIVWPAIHTMAAEEIAALRANGKDRAVLEAAVLFEAGWEDIVDEVWTVVVEPDRAVARLAERNGLDEEAARARINSQLTNEERIARSDTVIANNGSLEELTARCQEEWNRFAERVANAKTVGGNA